ncbi:MAG: Tn3 family transposase, partial [Cyanobacteria bacterium J06656_5]
RKRIKYNHLVANCVIFHNVVELTRVLNQIYAEGHRFEPEAIAALIPYLTWHINRFGLYQLDAERQPLPINFELAFEEGDLVLTGVSYDKSA